MYPFKDWLSPLSAKQSNALNRELGSKLLGCLTAPEPGHPLHHAYTQAFYCLEKGDLVSLAKLGDLIDYESCSLGDAFTLCTLRQIQALFQKSSTLQTGLDLEQVAYEKFLVAEKLCHETNTFFRMMRTGRVNPVPSLALVLDEARRKIRFVLGRCPDMSQLPFCFGPGATTTIQQQHASVQAKLAETPTCSEALARSALLPSFLREFPHWLEEHQCEEYLDFDGYVGAVLEVQVSTSRLIFVPKTAFTHRSIITQPTLNSMLQLGIGNYMGKRLRKMAGVDLRDQTLNQRLAKQGSLDGTLCTIDLSSASDTVSTELVRYLLPDDWYALLGSARCQDYSYRGDTVRLEHFSAMGNGFTFPLETLIFWALAKSVAKTGSVAVYGDDIIVASEYYEELTYVLRCCGFCPNQAKSFATGPFRESCGADYFFGIDIRPYYVKDAVSVESLYVAHNFFYRRGNHVIADWLRALIPDHLRRYGPDGYGDGHLLSLCVERYSHTTREARRSGWEGFFFRSFRRRGVKTPSIYPGDYISPLYILYVRGANPPIHEHLRGRSFSTPMECLKNGRLMFPVRGSSGYEEVSIYTLRS